MFKITNSQSTSIYYVTTDKALRTTLAALARLATERKAVNITVLRVEDDRK